MKTCNQCGKSVPEEARFCPYCGAAQEAAPRTCSKCGSDNPPDARFCRSCGTALPGREAPPSQQAVQAAPSRHLWNNPYFIIMLVAVVAMGVATIYNYSYIRIEQQKARSAANPQQPHVHEETPPQPASAEPTMDPQELEAHIQTLKEQIDKDPQNTELYVHMGNLLFDNHRFEEAIPYYEKAVQLDPTNPNVIVDLGVSYFQIQQFDKAKALFRTALTIDPNHVFALYNLGVVNLQMKDMNGLMEAWGKLLEIAPNSPQAQRANQILEEIHQTVNMNANGGTD